MRLLQSVAASVLVATVLASAVLLSPANATLIVTPGNTPGGIRSISVAGCTGYTPGPATTITGCLNSDHTIGVQFDSADETIQFVGNNARTIPSVGPGLDDLKISLIGNTFTQLVLNIRAQDTGTVSFSDNFGDISALFPLGTGNNRFTLSGDTFSFISFTSSDTHYPAHGGFDDGDVSDVRQIRFFGVADPDPVPEPATLALFGAGLAGFGAMRRRRKAKS